MSRKIVKDFEMVKHTFYHLLAILKLYEDTEKTDSNTNEMFSGLQLIISLYIYMWICFASFFWFCFYFLLAHS